MVLWIGFIGKLVALILTKSDGRCVDFGRDERKQAARAFLALHEALIQLDAVAVGVRDEINAVLVGRRSYLWRGPFERVARRGDAASRAFEDSLRDLQPVISIYDPVLAALLSAPRHLKEVLVRATTGAPSRMAFAVRPNPEGFAVHYSAPTERLLTADLERTYERVEDLQRRVQAADRGPLAPGRFEWPHDVLLSLIEENLVEGHMTDEDIAQARQLDEMVEKYAPFLTEARIRWGRFCASTSRRGSSPRETREAAR